MPGGCDLKKRPDLLQETVADTQARSRPCMAMSERARSTIAAHGTSPARISWRCGCSFW